MRKEDLSLKDGYWCKKIRLAMQNGQQQQILCAQLANVTQSKQALPPPPLHSLIQQPSLQADSLAHLGNLQGGRKRGKEGGRVGKRRH